MRGDIMVCGVVEGRSALRKLLRTIREKYNERKSKFTPPMTIKTLGQLGENQFGFCIVSKTGANPEMFEDIIRDAAKELRDVELITTIQRPILYLFEH